MNLFRIKSYVKYSKLIKWHLIDKYKTGLKILNSNQTVNLLLEKPKSFCRLGDGEMNIINNGSIIFQKYEPKLAEILRQILVEKNDNMYVGINYYYFHRIHNLNKIHKHFYFHNSFTYGMDFSLLCNKENLYLNAGFNQQFNMIEKFDFDNYFNKIRTLFYKKNIVVFCGKRTFKKMKYDVFELANNVIYEYGPDVNAFSSFKQILKQSRKYSKNNLLCFILGPTSKALVYYLAKDGYDAWDIGHLCKDYEFYMLNKNGETVNFKDFYE